MKISITCIICIVFICTLIWLFTVSVYFAGRDKLKGQHYETDEHKKQIDTVSNEDITIEFSDVTDEQNRELQKWREKQKYAVVSQATKYALTEISNCQFLVISGPPGSGKSFISYHVAFKQEERSYSVIPISKPEDIKRYALGNLKRILLFDDAFGRYCLDKVIFEMWRKEVKTIKDTLIDNPDVKLLVTCRSQIYRENAIKELPLHPVDCDLLSNNLKLSENERMEMCKVYLKLSIRVELDEDVINLYNFFPLLCSSFTTNEPHNTQSFFCNPVQFLQPELKQMKEKSDVAYMALALLVVLNDNVEKKMLEVFNYEVDVLLRGLFNELGLPNLPSKLLILLSLKALVGTYLKETETYFSFLHTNLFDNVSFCIGDKIIHSILKHGDSAFIRDRLQFLSLNEQHSELTIMLNKEQEDIYFARLLRDIKNGRNWDAIKTIQIDFQRYRSMLKTFLAKKLVKADIKKDVDGSTPLHVVANIGHFDLFQVLFTIDNGQVSTYDNKGRTPLHVASAKGNESIVQNLLNYTSIDLPDQNNITPLDFACLNGHYKVATHLIKNGANVNRKGENKRTPLHLACESGYKNVVDLLLKNGANVKLKDSKELTPLHLACLNNKLEVVSCLVSFKNVINNKDKDGRTPLFIACEMNNESIAMVLLENNASVNISNKHGDLPLHKSCKLENLTITQCLLEHGADIEAQDVSGSTPLYIACQDGRENVVDFLINHRANVNKFNNNKMTPLVVSCYKGHNTIVRTLLSNKADVDKCTHAGLSPLYIASSENNYAAVKLLIESNALVNMCTKTYDSPLHAACRKENEDIAAYLIKHGAEVNLKNKDGSTSLHIASFVGSSRITNLLLQYTADVKMIDSSGETPLALALANNHEEIVKILRDYGATE